MNAFSIFGRMSLDDSDYQRGLRSAEGETKKAAGRMAQDWKKVGEAAELVGKTLSVALTAPIVAFGALAIRTAGDFEAAMNKVRGITQATGTDFQRLEALAKDLGASTQFSASQAADAMGFLAMAGFNVEDIISSLPGVLELAAAGNLDLASAADIASNVLSGFGLEAGEVARVNDVLALASIRANTNVEQLGNAFKFVAPVAAALGVSVEESAAAIGIMSDAGIQGEMAGTALRNILGELAKESDELGINVYDLNGQMLPLADIIEQLEVRGLNTAEAMGEFGQRAGPALQALLSRGSGALRDLTTNLEDAGGTAARLATTNMEGFNGAVLNLRSAVEGLQIAIAQSGLLAFFQGLVERFTSLIRFLTALNPQLLQLITILSGVAAAIGPVLLTIGMLILQVPKFTAALVVLRGALASLFVGPQAIIVLAVLAVVALAEAYRRNFGGIQEKTEEVFRALREAFQNFREQFQVVIDALQTAWVRLTNAFGNSWDSMSEQIATIFASYINNVVGFIAFLLTNLARIIEIGVLIVEEWGLVSEGFRLIMQGISRTVQLVGQVISGSFSLAATAVQSAFVALGNSVRRIFIDMLNGIIGLVNNAISRLQGFADQFGLQLTTIQTLNTSTWAEIADTMKDNIAVAQAEVQGALQGIQATYMETVRNVGIILAELRAKLEATGQSTAELDDAIIEVGKATVTTTDAFQNFTGTLGADSTSGTIGAAGELTDQLNLLSLAGIDAAIAAARLGQSLAQTTDERISFQQQIEELQTLRDSMVAAFTPVDIPIPDIVGDLIPFELVDPGIQVQMQSTADAVRLIAQRYMELQTAQRETSESFAVALAETQAMEAASMGASTALGALVDLNIQAIVEIRPLHEVLRELAQAYLDGQITADAAATALFNYANAGLVASTSAEDFAAKQLALADAANAAEIGLGGSADAIADFAEGAANATARTVTSAEAALRLQRALALLGDESADVAGALVYKIDALEALLERTDPMTEAYLQLAEAIAAARGELLLLTNTKGPGVDFAQTLSTAIAGLAVTMIELSTAGGNVALNIAQAFAQMAQSVLNEILKMAVAELVLQGIRTAIASSSPFTWWMVAGLAAGAAAAGALVAQLRGMGARGASAGTTSAPTGVIGQLQQRRQSLSEMLMSATSDEQIELINRQIAQIDEELRRLRELGVETPERDSTRTTLPREAREMQFGGVPQSVQLAVATPLVEASRVMLDAATIMRDTFGGMLPGNVGFGNIPPFTDVLARMTPLLERLVTEGVSINVSQQSVAVASTPQLAFLR